MNASPKLISSLSIIEGEKLTAYLDTNNVWTIGDGFIYINDAITGVLRNVKQGDVITQAQCEQMLSNAIQTREVVLNNWLEKNMISLSQFQYDGAFDEDYQIGEGNFEASTLFRRIKAGVVDAPFTAEQINFLKTFKIKIEQNAVTLEDWSDWMISNIKTQSIAAAFLMWIYNGKIPSLGLLKRQIINVLMWNNIYF